MTRARALVVARVFVIACLGTWVMGPKAEEKGAPSVMPFATSSILLRDRANAAVIGLFRCVRVSFWGGGFRLHWSPTGLLGRRWKHVEDQGLRCLWVGVLAPQTMYSFTKAHHNIKSTQ